MLKPIIFTLHKSAEFKNKHIHDHVFTVSQVRAMMERAGFVDIKIRRFLFTFKGLPGVLLPFLKPTDLILEHIPLLNRTAAIIMVKGTKP
jgi:hypothetical protein